MSKYFDAGEVKARLSKLFEANLGCIKSANLAGEMVTRHWDHSQSDNENQRALSVLVAAATTLHSDFADPNEIAVYLWSHQKATAKRGLFFSIGTAESDKLKAYIWFIHKAEIFAEHTGESVFFETLLMKLPDSITKLSDDDN